MLLCPLFDVICSSALMARKERAIKIKNKDRTVIGLDGICETILPVQFGNFGTKLVFVRKRKSRTQLTAESIPETAHFIVKQDLRGI